ncbi:MAG: EAL domain-containing protein, partial [Thiohalomonadaceae bacterium]
MRPVGLDWLGESDYLVTLRDVTGRRRAEERLKSTNRAYAVLGQCNRHLIGCQSEKELLGAFCRDIVHVGGYRFACVTPMDDSLEAAVWGDANACALCTGQSSAASGAAPALIPNAAAFLLEAEGRYLGVLTVGTDATEGFDEHESHILAELARELSFGLHSLRIGRERDRANRLLEIRNRAIEAACNGIAILERESRRLVYVNPAFCHITGYTPEEVLGRVPEFMLGEREQSDIATVRSAMAQGRGACVVLRNLRKDGSVFWNELTIAPVRGAGGVVDFFVAILNDISERKRYEERLEYQANFDLLTGLPNRHLFNERLSHAIATARRHHSSTGVLFIDVDGFKLVNDTLDHRMGDQLLRIIARRIRGALRDSDTVARYGGDEFAVVLPGAGGAEVIRLTAERIMRAIRLPLRLGGREWHLTASIGASVAPRDGHTAAELLRNADSAMYQAKEAGRNTFRFYTSEMNARLHERLSLEAALRKAIEREELALVYQPQVDLRSGVVTAVEALARWSHPSLGPVPPARFIALAEETGLIVPLGEWVMHTACRQLRQWDALGIAPLSMAVNVSARQLRDRSVEGLVAEVLAATGLPPNRLELELTESAIMHNPEEIAHILSRLKQNGAALSIDDFGTGYSSLSYIHRFPIDRIKIDQSFTAEVNSNSLNAAICRTIIGMARALRMEVVAEGIETEAQLHFLKRAGCDVMQGFYFSPPVAGAELEPLLRRRNVFNVPAEGTDSPTVLVLDDEVNITNSLRRLLAPEGYRVLCANNTGDAFSTLASHKVHVVISDQHMPGMQGTDFLAEVKRIYPQIVRIILTGYSDQQSIMEAVNRGWVFKFLTKPWDDQHIRSIIREAFREAGDYARR